MLAAQKGFKTITQRIRGRGGLPELLSPPKSTPGDPKVPLKGCNVRPKVILKAPNLGPKGSQNVPQVWDNPPGGPLKICGKDGINPTLGVAL